MHLLHYSRMDAWPFSAHQLLILFAFSSQAIVIATPYQLAFDYDAMAEAAAARFERTARHQLHAFTGVAAALVPCTRNPLKLASHVLGQQRLLVSQLTAEYPACTDLPVVAVSTSVSCCSADMRHKMP